MLLGEFAYEDMEEKGNRVLAPFYFGLYMVSPSTLDIVGLTGVFIAGARLLHSREHVCCDCHRRVRDCARAESEHHHHRTGAAVGSNNNLILMF